ncbi:MAG: IS3 family transposase [Candidatus Kapaibacterium sp.]
MSADRTASAGVARGAFRRGAFRRRDGCGAERSGYYRFRKRAPSKRSEEDGRLVEEIRSRHQASRQTYGSPRLYQQLRQSGIAVSRHRVERLMRDHQIVGIMPTRRRITTTDARHGYPVAPNLLDRIFTAEDANRKWASDITYAWTDEGWLYLASVIDLFSRRIVGWSMSDRIDQNLTLTALRMAVQQRPAL